jgi:tetratricopeptide (TPR) repeat protein
MTRTRLTVGAAAAAAALVALLFGGVLRSSPPAGGAAPAAPAHAADAFGGGFAAGDTPSLVASLQADLRVQPGDVENLGLLGLAYQQRARETGDPAWYGKSEGVLRRALRLAPRDLVATSGLGSLALSRHRFGEALALGRRARVLSPSTARNYGVIGDALVELGRYRAAFAAFDTMARLKPGLAAYARISYARELRGDIAGARRAMRLALDSAVGEREALAWTHVQLAKLELGHGRTEAAAREARAALYGFPGYVYGLDALAQVDAARGRLRAAARLERTAAETIPLPQFVSFLGDLYAATGRPRLAHDQYRLIGAIERLLAANGVRTDLETALFDADHGRASLALARRAERMRPSIDGADVLAWTLERHGRCAEALGWSRRALRLGTRDALKFFHRGMIERCLGRDAAARGWFRRALALNPRFSVLWAPTARRLS